MNHPPLCPPPVPYTTLFRSVPEIEMVLAAGAAADRISYGNTIKKERDVARAHALGVRLFAVDCVAEVEKIALLLEDRKSTRLNSSHPSISYAVFCLK